MLSKFLSLLFMIGFVLAILLGAIKTCTDIRGDGIANPFSKNSKFFDPGLVVEATGKTGFGLSDLENILHYYNVDTGKIKHDSLHFYHPVDSPCVVVAEDLENLNTVQDVWEYETGKPTNKRTTRQDKLFAGIKQTGFVRAQFILSPGTSGQRVMFILNDLLVFGSYAFFLFIAALLCKRFGEKAYFSPANTRLFKYAGFLILLPELVHIIFYFLYFRHIYPVTGWRIQDLYIPIGAFDLHAGIEYPYIFLGLVLIIFSHVFKNAFLLKEENASIL